MNVLRKFLLEEPDTWDVHGSLSTLAASARLALLNIFVSRKLEFSFPIFVREATSNGEGGGAVAFPASLASML